MSGAQAHLDRTIAAGNSSRNEASTVDCQRRGATSVISDDFNLAATTGNGRFGGTGDIAGQDPLLAPPADQAGLWKLRISLHSSRSSHSPDDDDGAQDPICRA